MLRVVEPEILDRLPPEDVRAVQSRRDLVRLNGWMGHPRALAEAVAPLVTAATEIVELGAGDGITTSRWIARVPRPAPGRLVLVDRQPVVSPATLDRLAALGWATEVVPADALEYCRDRVGAGGSPVFVANLFLHHFPPSELAMLFGYLAASAAAVVACEPRRGRVGALASRLLRCIGAGEVTRHDAPVSVRAGFRGRELTELWPAPSGWEFEEGLVGWCSHRWVARRRGGSKP